MRPYKAEVDEADGHEGAPPASSPSEERSTLMCTVCGDLATGRHYGAIACNGCKGFFRRTIRRGYKYTCRFSSNCAIDRHNRAVCRYCRYTRCINAGMKVEAVQNERDVIGKRPRTSSLGSGAAAAGAARAAIASVKRQQSCDEPSCSKRDSSSPVAGAGGSSGAEPWESSSALLEALVKAESSIQSLRETVIKQTSDVAYSTRPDEPPVAGSGSPSERQATVNDIFSSIHSQLLLVIEWAKTLPPFAALSTEDQTALLKNFAAQHVVLCVAYRSIDSSDFLKLINDSKIWRTGKAGEVGVGGLAGGENREDFYARDCERIMDQLVAPMRFLKIDDIEFVALKACVLFNPVAKGLSPSSISAVLATRRRIFSALEDYVRRKQEPSRVGDLTFFILSPLQSLANSISEDILVTKLSGVAHIDLLMEELILADADEQRCADTHSSPRTANDMIRAKAVAISPPSFAEPTSSECTMDPLSDEFDFTTYPQTTLSTYNSIMDHMDSRPGSPVDLLLSPSAGGWNSLLTTCESSVYLNGEGF